MKHTDTADGVNGLLPEAGSREVGRLKADLAEKEAELSLNAKMLARQCDLAREAETQLAELRDVHCKVVADYGDLGEKHKELREKVRRFFNLFTARWMVGATKLFDAEIALRAVVEKPAADGLPEAKASKSFAALSEDKGLEKIVKGE